MLLWSRIDKNLGS